MNGHFSRFSCIGKYFHPVLWLWMGNHLNWLLANNDRLEKATTDPGFVSHKPIGSMGMVYLPTFYHQKSTIHVGKYTIHIHTWILLGNRQGTPSVRIDALGSGGCFSESPRTFSSWLVVWYLYCVFCFSSEKIVIHSYEFVSNYTSSFIYWFRCYTYFILIINLCFCIFRYFVLL